MCACVCVRDRECACLFNLYFFSVRRLCALYKLPASHLQHPDVSHCDHVKIEAVTTFTVCVCVCVSVCVSRRMCVRPTS